jgi:diguanylate cyclase (GGDEF)-like protein/PAS domain S-box-containing protein
VIFNERWAQMLGYTLDELEPQLRTWERLVHPDDMPHVMDVLNAHLEGKTPFYESEHRLRTHSGRWKWILARGKVMEWDKKGKPLRAVGTHLDITKRKRTEAALQTSESQYRELIETANSIILRWNAHRGIIFINRFGLEFFGFDKHEVIGKSVIGTIVPKTESTGRNLAQMMEQISLLPEPYANNENENIRKNGERAWISWTNKAIRDDQGKLLELLSIGNDITARKLAEQELRLAASVFENTIEGVMITDSYSTILRINPAFSEITGYKSEEIIGQNPRVLQSGRHDKLFYTTMWRVLKESGHWQGQIWNRRKNGENYPQLLSISAVHGEDNTLTHYIGIFTDITEQKRAEERIRKLAYYDSLTLLPNRRLFKDRLKQALACAHRDGKWLILLYLDLDRFKLINDSFGHPAGDQLLRNIVTRLQGCLRETDTVARLGGDEFTIILENFDTGEQAAQGAMHVATKILHALSKSLYVHHHEVTITSSIGIAMYPQDARTSSVLVKNADTAMYHAKSLGKNNFQFYSPEMNTKVKERVIMENRLCRALGRNEFLVYYQPQVNSQDGRINAVEALVRWKNEKGDIINPPDFLSIAEETSLILPLGEWILHSACEQLRRWQDSGHSELCLSVNISPHQFRQKGLVDLIDRTLKETGIAPDHLELEITESSLMGYQDAIHTTLKALKKKGIRIALDDFGTGYSSLSHLRRFSVDSIKIDRSFIEGIPDDSDDTAIIQAIIAMAQNLKLRVIAEGVETAQQEVFLRYHGCGYTQGFLYSDPVPANMITSQWLSQNFREVAN